MNSHSRFARRQERPFPREITLTAARAAAVIVAACSILCVGCVRRTLTITTEPPNALVYLNDQEVGRSVVTTDFLWYGDYDVIVRKEGYETLKTHWKIVPPWYETIPLDFFFEVLWPGELHDTHERHFVMRPQVPTSEEDLLSRAEELRLRAADRRR